MLIQFRFKNFKSFRDDTILDLSATKITEYSQRIISVGNEKLLPVAAIFGANASGKSNVIEAFRFMATYVMNSFSYGDENEDKKNKNNKLKCPPFLFDNSSKNAESSFEVYFIDTEKNKFKSYHYGFTLNQDGVIEEWLNSKAKTSKEYKRIFYRNENELELSGLSGNSQELIKISLNKETLIVSLGAKLKITLLKNIRDWFYNTNCVNFGNPIENAAYSRVIPDDFIEDKAIQENVVEYLSSFDSSIIGFDTKAVKNENGDYEEINIKAIHKTIEGETTSIPFEEESDGTLKMFSLYPFLQDTLTNGGVLFIDELNARLHPLLVRNFLLAFLNPEINKKHAQLVFTTHDSWQLSNNLLRRDEIWFTEKDYNGVSSLYSLADFSDEDGIKIRKDENYEKNYMVGKYGAIPLLNNLNMFNKE